MAAAQSQTMTQTQATSLPRLLLSLEGLAVLVGAVALYSQQSGEWGAFLLLLLAPDLGMLGYVANPRVGAAVYNIVHTYALPITLALVALAAGWHTGVSLALIWGAHIGMDRTLGYGLKYASGFKDTHFQRV